MLSVKIKKERENFILPKKSTLQAACFDVYISEIEECSDGMVICKLGFSTEIPKWWKGVIVSRSNITKHGYVLANGIGIVDSDYRGEWEARFRPLLYSEDDEIIEEKFTFTEGECYRHNFPYKVGEACCQIYFEPVQEISFLEVDSISDTERGSGGFGHTDGK